MIRIATRGSDLARWQAHWVGERLGGEYELVIVSTLGDRDSVSPLHEIGGTGLFVTEVQACVLDGQADVAVHSAKDLPGAGPAGLTIAAYPFRDSPWDSLVGCQLDQIPLGGTVATGSVRRRLQLRHLRPDLTFVELRGNMATRRAKVAQVDAIVVGTAAFRRLGWGDELTQTFDLNQMVPQVGQGALAVECRSDDGATVASIEQIDVPIIRQTVEAERAMLQAMGGGCEFPLGAFAQAAAGDQLQLSGFLGDLDSGAVVRATVCGSTSRELGAELSQRLTAALAEALGKDVPS